MEPTDKVRQKESRLGVQGKVTMALGITLIFVLLVYSVFNYLSARDQAYSRLDVRLADAAQSYAYIVNLAEQDEFVADGDKADPERVKQIAIRLTDYCKSVGIVYLYSIMQHENELDYVYSSLTEDEYKDIKKYINLFLKPYDSDAPKPTIARVLATNKAEHLEYSSSYGSFRTYYLPAVTPSGQRFVIATDVLMEEVDKATRGAILESLGVGGATLFLAVIALYSFLGQLRKSNKAVEQAHRETEDILRTTQDGLFLLDHEFRMGSQTSQALSRILGVEARPGENFLELLKPLVTPKTFETTKEYIELLLRHDVKEKLVTSLNPLDCIEITVVRPTGGEETRFLQIRFNRVLQDGKVTHLLVTATEITRRVKLERELKESERRVQDQMGMMVHILQADPRLLQDFISNATNGLNQINEDLRTSNPTTGVSTDQLDTMLRNAHQLKGDAAAMRLEAVTQSLHVFETLLQDLRAQSQRKSEDLLPVAVRVKALYAEIGAIQDVIARIGQVRGIVSVEPPRPERGAEPVVQQALVRQWTGFAQQLASRHEKQVELIYQGLDLETLTPQLHEALNSVVNQFIRNALVHGVESPAERKQRGKSEAAHISVYVSDQGDGTVELSFRDDGRGINPEDIREAVIRSGRFTPEAAKELTARQLTLLIFEPGFSTQKDVDEDAGRGIGLDAVKDLIARMGGRIRIGTTRGEYCHFRVQLPLKAEPREPSPDKLLKEVV